MDQTRDWRKKTEDVSAHEGPLDNYYDSDESKHTTLVPPSYKDEVKEEEVVAPLTLAPDGGWGWLVFVCSFIGVSISDGLLYCYGPMLRGIVGELQISESLGALNNSVLISTVYLMSPVSSALINRFGFRYIGMCGSIVCSVAWFAAYFTRNFASLLILYGLTAGVGFSMINLSVYLVVGFYFDKLRTIALVAVSCGSSVGIMAFYQINVYSVSQSGWRNTLLLHSGIAGFIYFLCLAFRPLPTIKITAENERSDSVQHAYTYLPNMSTTIEDKSLAPTITEKAMKTASNAYFPYATELMEAVTETEDTQPGPSAAPPARVVPVVTNSVDPLQMKEIRMQMNTPNRPDVIFQRRKKTKKGCCGNCCHWEELSGARPIYCDDVFYNSSKKVLKEYNKSEVLRHSVDKRTSTGTFHRRSLLLTRAEHTAAEPLPDETSGLKYRLAVTRVATTKDLEERKILCPTAVRRALASLLDPTLLRKGSFLMFCLTGFLFNLGALVPYVYLESRGLAKGVDPSSSAMFVSVMAFANLVGRLALSFIALKVSAVNVYGVTIVVTGLSTLLSSLSYSLVFQMTYCVVFGMSVAGASCMRAVVLVELYGLQSLTGGTGLALMFNGMANVVSTPLAGVLIGSIGFEAAFCVSGIFMTLAGIVVIPMKMKVYLERRQLENPTKRSIVILKEKHDIK